MRHLHIGQPEKSAVAEHTGKYETYQNTEFSNTTVLDKTLQYLIKDATEIRLHLRNFNMDF